MAKKYYTQKRQVKIVVSQLTISYPITDALNHGTSYMLEDIHNQVVNISENYIATF